MTSYRARLYRLTFVAAAAYNGAFGVWAGLFPRSFFSAFDLAEPRYPSIWACLGMVIGLYGLGYAYAAWRLDRAAPFIAIGLLGKLLGPVGWIAAVASGEWPTRTFTLIMFNDIVWWAPFGLFLADETRLGAKLRATAPYICAALNLAALTAMATMLRPGTEMVPLVDDRVRYITDHPALWRGGWLLWTAAALSLACFYAWWGSYVRDVRWAIAAVSIASAGLICDLFAESLLIGWLPRDYDRLAPLTTLLTGAAANGLYTAAGITLTLASERLPRALRAMAWTAWVAGIALTACTLAGAVTGIAVATTVLFLVFCPWVILVARSLDRAPAAA